MAKLPTSKARSRRSGRSKLQRSGLSVLALVMLSGGLYFAGKSGTNPEAYGNDFNVYYHAAREVIGGRDPYQNSLGDWTPYIYPPLLAELIVPLALFPVSFAAYLWFLISAASIVAAALMSASLAAGNYEPASESVEPAGVQSMPWPEALAGCAVVLVLRFVLDTLDLGQVNAVVAALAVAHVYLYARDRKALSAVALVVAVSIKLTPALLLIYHLAKMRLKFALACTSLIVAVTALSFLPFESHGTAAFQTFWGRTVKNEQGYDLAYSGNQSLRGVIARLTGSVSEVSLQTDDGSRKPSDAVTLLISLLLLASAVFAAVRARSELAAVAPFFCCVILLSPLSWKAHYVILILPAALLLTRARASGKGRPLIVTALIAAFALFNLTSPRVIGLEAAEWADEHSLIFAGALLLFIACSATAMTRKFGNGPHVC